MALTPTGWSPPDITSSSLAVTTTESSSNDGVTHGSFGTGGNAIPKVPPFTATVSNSQASSAAEKPAPKIETNDQYLDSDMNELAAAAVILAELEQQENRGKHVL